MRELRDPAVICGGVRNFEAAEPVGDAIRGVAKGSTQSRKSRVSQTKHPAELSAVCSRAISEVGSCPAVM